MSATYLNPWHGKVALSSECTPTFTTDSKPKQHRGFLIYQRVPGSFEVVKDGVCLTQRAGLHGALWAIDNLIDNPNDWQAQRMAGYLALATQVPA
ncbi:hypothetical protein AE929_09600 [Xanthomonas arboricola]|uniref:Uncharacterized protein n=1 Tax=Xanthomonas campestris pv. juglandis TaxID=195709 RepID=A0A8E4GF33_XANCJ|nr:MULTISPECIES: hypothetical protein [Xanthomonas]KOA98603.1 hypothetical protein AE920_14975 [Xanthomonas arboricola]KOB16853.1 hypothetical protein AE924_06830 [Xanthomonas arboricola]KOB25231.1 hypothetical protein AE927_16070 [Xanthomonas arboricola]KOB35695.1 hypothetical protein AE929_09600 [Xanthomonas arboricola]KOB45389.1 hypothetical protein AE931_05300 [Xanthomonas arboricola]